MIDQILYALAQAAAQAEEDAAEDAGAQSVLETPGVKPDPPTRGMTWRWSNLGKSAGRWEARRTTHGTNERHYFPGTVAGTAAAVAWVEDGRAERRERIGRYTEMKLERYCTCGAVLKVTVDRRKRQQALIVWTNQHSGPGHADTDAATAEAARMGYSTPMGREAARQERER